MSRRVDTDTDIKRNAVMGTEKYTKGEPFLTTEMVACMERALGRKLKDREATSALYEMKKNGLLDSFDTGHKCLKWFKPMDKQLTVPWRTEYFAFESEYGEAWL